MTNISIDICGAQVHKPVQEGLLTTGMVGATATMRFDDAWEGLKIMAVFRGSGVTKTDEFTGGAVRIPVEVLAHEGYLEIGAEGYGPDGDIVIPTVWVTAGRIHTGANATGDPAADPEAPNWTRAVLYAPQELTEEQKAQARKNIGVDAPQAAGAGEYVFTVTGTPDAGYTADKPYEEVLAAYEAGRTVICVLNGGMAANFRLPLIMASDGVLAFALSPIPGTIFMVSLTPSGCMVSESISTMTIGDQEWDFDGPVDFTDTIKAMIDEKMGTRQGGGKWEIISEHTIDSVVSADIPCNFDDYRKVMIIFNGFGTTPNAGKINAHFMYADTDKTQQMVQTIGTFAEKRYGYILIDMDICEIRYAATLQWANAGANMMSIPNAPAQRYFENAIGIRFLCIDSAGGGTNVSTTNTMGGNIIIKGIRA